MSVILVLFMTIVIIISNVHYVYLHGMLMYPPMRGSMWRFYKNFPINYNDNGLACGNSFTSCGICGDSIGQQQQHALTGRYGKVSVLYPTRLMYGQNLTTAVKITANHRGYFYYEYCNLDNFRRIESEHCFVQFTKNIILYQVPPNTVGTIHNDLGPLNFFCKHCILRWTWITNSNWVDKPCNQVKNSCGQQQIFKNCADFSIE